MKKADILVGHKYTNGRDAIREVIAEGKQYCLYPGQNEDDCVRYRLLTKGKTGTGATIIGEEYNTTRAAFAYWAKKEIVKEVE